jgi:threonyl-tRNA synthetase
MLVVGDKEAAARTVAPRARSGETLEPMTVEAFIELLRTDAKPGRAAP